MWTLGAFAIIFDAQGGVLLCHRRDMDAWNLPGGHIESGELPTEAVKREVKEETGLEVSIERLAGVYGKSDRPDDLVFSFICRPVGGRLQATEEASECRYFQVDEIPANTSPKHVERIQDVLGAGSEVLFRRQDAPSTQARLRQLQIPDQDSRGTNPL